MFFRWFNCLWLAMTKYKIANVVATASLFQKIDFGKLRGLGEILYNSNVYGGNVAYFKTKNMQGKVSIFSSGKMISVGTKSKQNAFLELRATRDFLVEKGIVKPVKLQPQLQNLVVAMDLGVSLNLEKLAEVPRAIYEPEQFPALIMRLDKPCKASVLIFASGKIVVTGLKSLSKIKPFFHQVQNLANQQST
jgi:transcription initiation factor TFIID TATA-box-binding protein